MSNARTKAALLVGCLFLAVAASAQQASLSGRIYDAQSTQGIPSLAIQLVTPGSEGNPIVTYTDANGRFRFSGLSAGTYLFTVSQGPTLLHREVVQVNGETIKDVSLQHG